jgi:hypothetical protein
MEDRMSVPFLEKNGLPDAGEQVRQAHAQFHKTRCVGWMLATGMRPKVDQVTMGKGPQEVELVSVPKPHLGYDVHPVEE